MNVRKVVAGSVLAAGLGVAGMMGAGMASADVTDNPTTNDEHGFGIANHIHNFNDGFNGIGHLRSEMTGAEVSAGGGHRGPDIVVTAQGSPDSPSQFGPISNAGGKKK